MRNLILSLLLIAPTFVFGQLINEIPHNENGQVFFTKVVSLKSKSKEELYLNSKQYFVETFKSANDVIQMDDKEAATIIGKGFTDVFSVMMGISTPVKMWYTIKIQSKEGRYKYDIYDIYFECYGKEYVLPNPYVHKETAEDMFDKKNYYKKNGKPLKLAKHFKSELLGKIEVIGHSIENSMKKSMSSSDDNW